MPLKIQIPTDYFYFYKTGTGFCTDSRMAVCVVGDFVDAFLSPVTKLASG
jgi:hypothetical protein